MNDQQLKTSGSNSTKEKGLDEGITVIELSTYIEDRMYRREDYPFPTRQKAMDHLRIETISTTLLCFMLVSLTAGGTGQRNMMVLDHADIVVFRISLYDRWN